MKLSSGRHVMFLAVLLIASVLSTKASAHPPKEVTLGWNPNGNLTVNVRHGVDDPEKHYIYRITVYVDNKVAATNDFKSQAGNDGLSVVIPIGPQPEGTNITAEAFCVIMGSAVGSLVVP